MNEKKDVNVGAVPRSGEAVAGTAVFLLIVFILCIVLVSPKEPIKENKKIETKPNYELINNLKYFKDEKTDLCFAALTDDNNILLSLTNVPCSKKVDKNIFVRKRI